ncbi:hypothetical protein C5C34_00910 [Rathayibacter rathayi]|nr:hypothetical protein C5C34_00910 [Rathayibacter rathayi]
MGAADLVVIGGAAVTEGRPPDQATSAGDRADQAAGRRAAHPVPCDAVAPVGRVSETSNVTVEAEPSRASRWTRLLPPPLSLLLAGSARAA